MPASAVFWGIKLLFFGGGKAAVATKGIATVAGIAKVTALAAVGAYAVNVASSEDAYRATGALIGEKGYEIHQDAPISEEEVATYWNSNQPMPIRFCPNETNELMAVSSRVTHCPIGGSLPITKSELNQIVFSRN